MKVLVELTEFDRQEQRDAERLSAMWERDASEIIRGDGMTREECVFHHERHRERAKRFAQLAEWLAFSARPREHDQD